MDPFSLTVGALSVVGISVGTCAKILHDVRGKYKGASLTIASITTECVTVQAAPCQIENLTEQDPERYVSRLALRPDLKSALDTAITGCMTTFAVLEDELDKLSGALNKKTKIQYLWNESMMQELLQQIRSQVSAINFLMMAIQSESIAQCTNLIRDTVPLLKQIAHQTQDLRSKSPRASHVIAESIFSAGNSTVGSLEFAFDDEIINSKAYRRLLRGSKTNELESQPFPEAKIEPEPVSNIGSALKDVILDALPISNEIAPNDGSDEDSESVEDAFNSAYSRRKARRKERQQLSAGWSPAKMEAHYLDNPKPSSEMKTQYAKEMGVSVPRINAWLQNRRAKDLIRVNNRAEQRPSAVVATEIPTIPFRLNAVSLSGSEASSQASIETYRSEESSEHEIQIKSLVYATQKDLRHSTPNEFGAIFRATQRLFVQHDDTTIDGNMNLRIETEVRKERIQLFHLRMHNLRKREFSFRRYCRDSGREVCHTVLKKITLPSKSRSSYSLPGKQRPRLERSVSNALSSVRRKASSAASSMGSLRRTGSHRGSISSRASSRHSSVANHDGYEAGDAEDLEQPSTVDVSYDFKTLQFEFSNYAKIEVKIRGLQARRKYEFEYWGNLYTWKKKKNEKDSTSYYLTRDDNTTLAHMMPVLQSPSEKREEEQAGGWVHPCTFWFADRSILSATSDVADVAIATGIVALVDDSIEKRFGKVKK